MQKALKEIIQSQQHPTHCFICDAKFPNENNADHHYASNRHRENVKVYRSELLEVLPKNKSTEVLKQVETSAKSPWNETLYCDICKIQLEVNEARQHYKGDEHKSKEEVFCVVCKILTMSRDQLWNHLLGSKHRKKLEELELPPLKVQYSPFDLTLPISLRKTMTAGMCQLCEAEFLTVRLALAHYKTAKHTASIQHWFKVKKQNEKLGCSDNKNIKKDTNGISPQNSETKPTRVVDYNCFVCKMNVHTESIIHPHRLSFPHTELAKLKSDLVSQGIIEEFWIRQGQRILCTLCNVQAYTVSDATEHFSSSRHITNFLNWCSQLNNTMVPLETDTKWFYCRICDKPLDCTSDSEKHYLAMTHQKKSQLYCEVCDVRNSTLEMLEIHKTTSLHITNMEKSGNVEIKKADKQWYPKDWENQTLQNTKDAHKTLTPDTSLQGFKVGTGESTASLKEQVFAEIEKLVQTLYYSKTVPYNVALEYLKKVNRDIDDLKTKCGRKESPDSASASNRGFERNAAVSDPENIQECSSSKDMSIDDEFYSLNNDSLILKEIQPQFDLIDFSDDLTPTVQNIPEETQPYVNLLDLPDNFNEVGSNLGSCNSRAWCASDKNTDNDKNHHLNQREDWLHLGERDTLDIMLEEIVLWKNQVEEKCPNGDNVEKDVLTEIERLIELIKEDDIPLDETLMCLQNFNKELDFQLFRPQVEEEEEKVEAEGENADGGGEREQEQRPVKYRYSKEDLMSLRSEKTFTEQLSLQLRMSITDACLWNQSFATLRIWNKTL